MRTRCAFTWFFAVFLMLPGIFFAQSNARDDWSILHVLRTDEKLEVRLRSGKNVNGVFGSVNGRVLTVVRANKMMDVSRDEIVKIYLVSPKHIGGLVLGLGHSNRELIYEAKTK
jgi:hypothetical protein